MGQICDRIEKKSNNGTRKVWITFLVYFVLYLLVCLIFKDQQFLWLLLSVLSIGISIYLLAKNKFPKGKALLLPTLFAVLYIISTILNFNWIGTGLGVCNVFLSYCAVISTYKSVIGEDFEWVRRKKKSDVFKSILIGIGVGIVWGSINYLLMKGSNPIVPTNIGKALIVSLNPAIAEEIADRTLFLAFCIYAVKGVPTTPKEKFTCWFMMIVPHILPHMMFSLEGGLVNALIHFVIYLLLYIVIFGFVFAFLQRKRDLLSAMVAHGLVDAIRFSIFGLPF